MSAQICPTCGSVVRVEGDVTKYFVPIAPEIIKLGEVVRDNRSTIFEALRELHLSHNSEDAAGVLRALREAGMLL